MLKKFAVVCGLLLAATAAMAVPPPCPWEPLDPTPHPVGLGSHITYGIVGGSADGIWGMFPVVDQGQQIDATFVAYFFPLSRDRNYPDIGQWHAIGSGPISAALVHTGLTFQWQKALYIIGAYPGNPPDGHLYRYDVPSSTWSDYNISEINENGFGPLRLGDGCCIAYAPNPHYGQQGDLTEGWIYCLPGYRYGEPPYGMGFWRYAIRPGSTGFEKLADIPESVLEGATMAYMRNESAWPGDPSILVLPGADYPAELSFYRWGVTSQAWTNLALWGNALSPMPPYPGTSLTTADPLGFGGTYYAQAAFGGSVQFDDHPWQYEPNRSSGYKWLERGDAYDPYPQTLGPGADFVMGPAPFCYLTTGAPYVYGQGTGAPTNWFYAIDPLHSRQKKHNGGSQAGDVRVGALRAQVITSSRGVNVEYQLAAAAHVRATLHDVLGRQVGVLDIGMQTPGTHRLSWNEGGEGRELASGAYFVLLNTGTEQVGLKAVVR